MTHIQIDVQYGEYTIVLSTLEDRTMCNIYMTAGHNSVMTNRTITVGATPRRDLDFYLAGIEVFAREAISFALREKGASNPK